MLDIEDKYRICIGATDLEEVLWCVLWTNDIVLVDEHKKVNLAKLGFCGHELELRDLRVSWGKEEHTECHLSTEEPSRVAMRFGDKESWSSKCFRYLGILFQRDGDIDQYVMHKIQCGWLKCTSANGVLCDREVPLMLARKFIGHH